MGRKTKESPSGWSISRQIDPSINQREGLGAGKERREGRREEGEKGKVNPQNHVKVEEN